MYYPFQLRSGEKLLRYDTDLSTVVRMLNQFYNIKLIRGNLCVLRHDDIMSLHTTHYHRQNQINANTVKKAQCHRSSFQSNILMMASGGQQTRYCFYRMAMRIVNMTSTRTASCDICWSHKGLKEMQKRLHHLSKNKHCTW